MPRQKVVGIYKISSPTGKIYIGQSRDIKERWRSYRRKRPDYDQRYITRSLIKYGHSAHKFELIHHLPIDVDQHVLDEYEKLYMDAHIECGFILMNLRGGGSHGLIPEEVRKKISESKKKMALVGALSASFGRPVSEETRLKMSLNRKEVMLRNPEHNKVQLERMANAKRGKKNSLEHTAKIVAFHKGRKRSAETIRKIKAAIKGKKIGIPQSPEHIAKRIASSLATKSLKKCKESMVS